MTDQTTAPTGVVSSTELGFLPPYKYGEECGKLERVWTERDMHTFAAQRVAVAVAAERERCAKLCEDYAMQAMFDGDPEADHEGAAQLLADKIRKPNTTDEGREASRSI